MTEVIWHGFGTIEEEIEYDRRIENSSLHGAVVAGIALEVENEGKALDADERGTESSTGSSEEDGRSHSGGDNTTLPDGSLPAAT